MNFYEYLEIENTATAQEIKKAYFRLVRKYTPEKDPEKFMQLRQAYETLSDENKRNALDIHLAKYENTPKEVVEILLNADMLIVKGLRADAVSLLEKSEYSKQYGLQVALCKLYLDMDKSGTAVKIAERLVKDNPDNADCLRLAVIAYTKRGWERKAFNARKLLESIDPCNEDNSPALLLNETEQFSHEMGVMVEAIEASGKKAPLLCTHIVNNCFWQDIDDLRFMPHRLFHDEQPNDWDDPVFAAKKLAEHTQDVPADKKQKIYYILKDDILQEMFNNDIYEPFPHIDQTIRNIQAEDLFDYHGYKIAAVGYSALKAVKSGTPRELVVLSLMRAWIEIGGVGDLIFEGYQTEVRAAEIDIIHKSSVLIPHIRKFQKDPFYQHGADFFELVLKSSEYKLDNEFRRRLNNARDITTRFKFEWLGGNESQPGSAFNHGEPVRVTKIGRNEPCPCGSGKKYKKCCGGA